MVQEPALRERANILAAIKDRFREDWAFLTCLEGATFITVRIIALIFNTKIKGVGTYTHSLPNLFSQFEKAVQIRTLFIKKKKKKICRAKGASHQEKQKGQ